jgi:hypothetical protein
LVGHWIRQWCKDGYSKTHGTSFFSIIGISVAATLNWRNSVWAYWINFATVGITDTGFIFLVLKQEAEKERERLTGTYHELSVQCFG